MDNFNISEWGTFKDSLKAPVYGWFTYPAGFSYKAVEYSFRMANLKPGDTVYDPFMGSGTTNLAAKTQGLNSYGVEAHPFVYPIAKCKLNWDIDPDDIKHHLVQVATIVNADQHTTEQRKQITEDEFPKLVLDCFLPDTLYELLLIRNYVRTVEDSSSKLLLSTGLICVLRVVSIAATGWPYIAPNKIRITAESKKGLDSYVKLIQKMLSDIAIIRQTSVPIQSTHNLILGDSRNTIGIIPDESVNHIFTSPPYLNNFDYADRTRLEMYFMGDAKNWNDICETVRTKLITSATTQINRKDPKYLFSEEFIRENPEEYAFLQPAVNELTEIRKTKGGKKSYDFLVSGYFQDLHKILKDNYRVLRGNSVAQYIVGDSAPYGVHIPTDELIARIGCNIGFIRYEITELRTRGDKWKDNPQRHNEHLRETIITLYK